MIPTDEAIAPATALAEVEDRIARFFDDAGDRSAQRFARFEDLWAATRMAATGGKRLRPQLVVLPYLLLDGARRRTSAFDALVAPGQFAVVHLMVDAPPDVTTSIPHTARGVRVYRIAVPLTETAPPTPPSGTP